LIRAAAALVFAAAVIPGTAKADYYDEIDRCAAVADLEPREKCLRSALTQGDARTEWTYVEYRDSMTDEITAMAGRYDKSGRNSVNVFCKVGSGDATIAIELSGLYQGGRAKAMFRFDDAAPSKVDVIAAREMVLIAARSEVGPGILSAMRAASRLRVRIDTENTRHEADFSVANYERVHTLLASRCGL